MSETQELELVQLLQKYENNAAAFSKDFTNIWYDHDGTVQEIYKKQLIFLNTQNLPQVRVVLKPRQSGFSSAIVAKVVHSAYFKKSPEILIVSKSQKQAQKALDRIRKAFNSMPEGIRPEFLKETQEELKLANGVNIYSLSPVPDNCRGFTGDVYLDEFGSFGKQIGLELWEAIAPSITKGFSITVVGTPKGRDNYFFDLCTKTASEISKTETENDNWRLKVHWSDVPHIARNVQILRSSFTPLMWAQEYELEFLEDSEEAYFTREFIESNCYNKIADDFGLLNINYKIYKEAEIKEEEKFHFLKDIFLNIYIGWDMAKVQDQSIVTIIGQRKDDQNKFQLIDIHQLKGDYSHQSKCVSILAQLTNAKRVGYDSTAIGKVVEEFLGMTKIANRIAPVKFHQTTKIPMYTYMRAMISNKNLLIPEVIDEDVAIEKGWQPISAQIFQQFTSLEYNPIAQRIEAKTGEYDDIPSSFLCAIEASKYKKIQSKFSYVR